MKIAKANNNFVHSLCVRYRDSRFGSVVWSSAWLLLDWNGTVWHGMAWHVANGEWQKYLNKLNEHTTQC